MSDRFHSASFLWGEMGKSVQPPVGSAEVLLQSTPSSPRPVPGEIDGSSQVGLSRFFASLSNRAEEEGNPSGLDVQGGWAAFLLIFRGKCSRRRAGALSAGFPLANFEAAIPV